MRLDFWEVVRKRGGFCGKERGGRGAGDGALGKAGRDEDWKGKEGEL